MDIVSKIVDIEDFWIDSLFKGTARIVISTARFSAEKLRRVERAAILAQAQADAAEFTEPGEEIPQIVDDVPDDWKKTEPGRIHHFGTFWPNGPTESMCVSTYIPEIHFPEGYKGRSEMTGSGRFTLGAN
jgi:hypothetical protein